MIYQFYKLRSLIFFLFLGFLIFTNAEAQERSVLNFQNRGAQYQIGSDDELLIKVNIWGFVQSPGQYLVPRNTDLVSLISYAGGPAENAKLSKIKIVRTFELETNGTNGKLQEKIIEFDIKKFLETGDMTFNPQLMPNDMVMIKGTTSAIIAKSFQYLGQLAIIANLTYLIIRIEKDR